MPWLDQLTLPVALHALNYKTRALSERFNYPLHIKPLSAASLPPFFCHYHSLGTLVRRALLHMGRTGRTGQRFPELRKCLRWMPTGEQILAPAPRLAFSEGDSTGTARGRTGPGDHRDSPDGTSHLCRLLSQQPDTVVLNEPPQVFEALKLASSLGTATLLRRVTSRHPGGQARAEQACEWPPGRRHCQGQRSVQRLFP